MKHAIVLLVALLVFTAAAKADPQLLAADAAFAQAKSGQIVLLDIRRPAEWRQTGVPSGALPLTMHTEEDSFYRRVLAAVGGDKTKAVALICAAGNRSSWASGFLERKGFTNVRNVAEGFFGNASLPGWRARAPYRGVAALNRSPVPDLI